MGYGVTRVAESPIGPTHDGCRLRGKVLPTDDRLAAGNEGTERTALSAPAPAPRPSEVPPKAIVFSPPATVVSAGMGRVVGGSWVVVVRVRGGGCG